MSGFTYIFAQSLPADAAAAEFTTETLRDLFVKGGWCMYPLSFVSIIAVALVIVYLFTMTRRNYVSQRYMQSALQLIRKRDFLGLIALSDKYNVVLSRIVERSVDFMTENPAADFSQVREIAQTEGARIGSELNQRIAYLADIAAIAPMIGLLGTVSGMIKAFSVVAHGVAGSQPILLAGGVAEALITTAAGLVIAIPAMAAYSYFRGRVQGIVTELEAATTRLLSLLATNSPHGNTASTAQSPTPSRIVER